MYVVPHLKSRLVMAGQYIFKNGEWDINLGSHVSLGEGSEIFFVNHGIAEVEDGDGELIAVYGEGAHFGHRAVSLLGAQSPSVVARTTVDLFVVEKRTLHEVGRLHPDFQKMELYLISLNTLSYKECRLAVSRASPEDRAKDALTQKRMVLEERQVARDRERAAQRSALAHIEQKELREKRLEDLAERIDEMRVPETDELSLHAQDSKDSGDITSKVSLDAGSDASLPSLSLHASKGTSDSPPQARAPEEKGPHSAPPSVWQRRMRQADPKVKIDHR